jgi:hypothetical protein
MGWGDLAGFVLVWALLIALLLVLLIAPPILFASIVRKVWKRWRPVTEPRRVVVYVASFAVWLPGFLAVVFFLLRMSMLSAPPLIKEAPPSLPAFPWPPPAASAETTIPDRWLPSKGEADLARVADILERALRAADYPKWSYSSVPNGFALVTQMEQIGADGTPSPKPARWSANLPWVSNMTLLEFLRALINAQPGYYRVIVFIVTNRPWSRTGSRATGKEADQWLTEGFVWLPKAIGTVPYGPDYRTTVLVYEFEKNSKEANATLVMPSQTTADDHLKKAGVSEWLSRH